MIRYFAMLAAYNRWANRRLYEAAAALPDADYRADRGAFFKSMNGTLNHLLVTDRIWMRRFTGEGEVAPTLDTILHDDFVSLDAARRKEDERIMAYAGGLREADLPAMMTYQPLSAPDPVTQPRWEALAHWFNHQTHHRGQAHTILSITGGNGAAPSLDLVLFQRTDEFRRMG